MGLTKKSLNTFGHLNSSKFSLKKFKNHNF